MSAWLVVGGTVTTILTLAGVLDGLVHFSWPDTSTAPVNPGSFSASVTAAFTKPFTRWTIDPDVESWARTPITAGFSVVEAVLLRPLPYADKLALMMAPIDLPVTRDMTVKELTRYLDSIQREFSAMGVRLTDPDELRFGRKA